jgi:cell division septum initiation protein DivIVA
MKREELEAQIDELQERLNTARKVLDSISDKMDNAPWADAPEPVTTKIQELDMDFIAAEKKRLGI